MPWVSQFRKGLVDFCILLVVGSEELYGYSLVRRMRDMPNLSFTEGTVYPALARLIEDNLVRTTERRSSQGPPRRYLSLTRRGRHRLAEMRAHWLGVCGSVETLMHISRKGGSDES